MVELSEHVLHPSSVMNERRVLEGEVVELVLELFGSERARDEEASQSLS